MPRNQPPVQFQLPDLPPWGQKLLGGLFALFAFELFCRNILRLPIDQLVWAPFGTGFAWYQPFTRYLIQGNGVFGVFISLVVMYFFLPALERSLTREQAIGAFGSAVVAGTALAFAADLLGIAHGAAMGWSVFVTAMVVLFGLSNPEAVIYLMFIIPVPAGILVWGTAALTFLGLLAAPSLLSADHFGSVAGVIAWWNYFGPGARRRALLKKSRDIERELGRFQVLQGGKNRPGDDGTIH